MGKKKKQAAPPSGPKGAPEWVVTFTDMVSLLVTFFVLMMTFSSLREDELMKLPKLLQKFAGVHEMKGNTLVSPQYDQVTAMDLERGHPQPHTRPAEELPEDIVGNGVARDQDKIAKDLNDVSDGLLLEFGADEVFDPGSAEVPSRLRNSLERLGEVLKHYPHLVVVEGYTDNAYVNDASLGDEDEISMSRALAAVDVLLGAGVNPLQLQVAALGSRDPRSTNNTPEGRRQNRRIEVRILAMSKSHAKALERAREDMKNGGGR